MDVNYFFIAAVALFFICIVNGYRKGFLRIVISLLGIILVIAAVTVVSPHISDYLINHTKTYDSVKQKVISVFEEDNSKLDNSVPQNQTLTIESYDLPDILKTSLIKNNTAQMYQSLMVTIFEDYIAGYLAKLIINAISFIGMFLMLTIFLWFVLFSADIIARIPIIKGLNKILGAAAGFVKALIIVWVFFFVVIIFFGNEIGNTMMTEVKDSQFLSFLFNCNILLRFIS